MDISSVSAPSTPVPSRPNSGASGLAQATSVASAPASAKEAGSPTSPPSNALAETRGTPSPDRLAQAVKQANESFKQSGQNLYASFEKDKVTGADVVKIVDKKTNETIRQLPSKEMVAFAQLLENPQGMRGKLIHTTA